MREPLVSIIIPVYNGSNFVADALNSAINQSYKNLEILVINDGSTDGGKTKAVVEPFLEDNRVQYIEKENGGVSSVLNMGIKIMKGEFFCWLSHDDMMHEDSVKKRIKLWNSLGQNEKTIISTSTSYIDAENNTIFRVAAKSKNVNNIFDIISSTINGCSLLIPASLIKGHKFREDMIFMQDYYLWATLINEGARIKLLNKKLTYNRVHDAQVTTNRVDLLERDFGEFAKTFIDPLIEQKDYIQLKNICFCLEEHMSTRPFYRGYLLKYIFVLKKYKIWTKSDDKKIKRSGLISWAVGKVRKPEPPVEMDNTLKKVVFVADAEVFYKTSVWDKFVSAFPEVDFTYLVTNENIQKEYDEKFGIESHSFAKKSYEMDENQISDLFENVDVVVYDSCFDARVEKYLIKAEHLVVQSEHLKGRKIKNASGKTISKSRFFNKEHKNWKIMDRYLLSLSYYTYNDFKKQGFENKTYRFGYFPDIPFKEEKRDPYKLLYYGKLLKWKGVQDAIYALKFLKEKDSQYTLDIIGEGPYENALRKLVKKWNLESSVNFYPFTSREDVYDKIRKCNIAFFPSYRTEGWNISLNEMLSQKAIVFANLNAGISPYLVSKKNAFIYKNRRTLKEKLKIFIDYDPDELETLRNNAHDTIYNEWNNENAAKRLFEFLTAVVRKQKRFNKFEKGPLSKHVNWHKKKISEETNIGKIETKSKKNIAIGTIFGYLTVLLAVLSGLILIPWILNPETGIGEEAYGVYGLATSLIALFMLDFGLAQSLNTYLAKLRTKNDKEGIEKFIATVFKLYLLLDLVFAVIIVALYFLVDQIYIAYTQAQRDLLKPVLLIVGGFSLINFPTTCFTSALTTYEKFGFAKFTEFANKLLYFVLTIVAIKMGWGLIGLVSVNVASGLVAIIMRYFYMRFYLGIRLRLFTKINRKTVQDIFKLSVWALILGICTRLIFNITPSILGIVSKGDTGAEEGAIFSVITTIEGYIFIISTIMSTFFMAKIARTDTESPEERQKHLQELANRIGKLQFVVISLILLGFASVGQEFLSFWMNRNDYFAQCIYFGIITLCATEIVNIPELIFEQAMYTEGYIKPLAINAIVKACVNLGLSFWLSREYGAYGACIAIACARLVALVLNNIVYKKYLHISFTSFFSSIYIRGAISMGVTLAVGLCIHFFVPIADPKLKFLLGGVAVVLVYGIMTFFVTFNVSERYYYFDSLKRLIGIGKPKYVREKEAKIKVLHVVGEMVGGGVESFIMTYFRELHDQFDFTFVIFDTSTIIPREEIEALGGKIIIVPHVKKYFKFKKAFKKILSEEHYDIIHSHINTLSVFPLKIAVKLGCTVRIAHSHSTSSRKEVLRNSVKSVLKLFSKSYATHYLACSESAGIYQFGKYSYKNGNIMIVRNAIDIEKFAYNDENRKQIRKSLDLTDDNILVGNFGRLVKVKNQKYILKMAEITKTSNPSINYLIAGSGDLESDLQKTIESKKLTNVKLIQNVPDAYRYYSALDVLVLPSLYEGLGLTAIEAEANGLYCLLSTNVPKETLLSEYGKYLPIDDKNIDLWVKEISNKHDRVELKEKLYEAHYDIKSASEDLANFYRRIA